MTLSVPEPAERRSGVCLRPRRQPPGRRRQEIRDSDGAGDRRHAVACWTTTRWTSRHRHHARSLAFAGRDSGLRSRQARLRRKADFAQHPRRPHAGRRRRSQQSPGPTRHAKPQHADDDRRRQTAARRDHRQCDGRQVLEHPAPRFDRSRHGHRSAGRFRLRDLGRPGDDDSLSHQPRPQPLDAGGITSAPATWGTTASTTSTTPAGDSASTCIPPKSSALGGKFAQDDDQEFPDTQQVTFEYPGDGKAGHRKLLIYEQRLWSSNYPHNVDSGAEFYGTAGQMFLSRRGKIQVLDDQNKPQELAVTPMAQDDAAHVKNFVDAIRTGATLNCRRDDRASVDVVVSSRQHRHAAGTIARIRSATRAIRRRRGSQSPRRPRIPRPLGPPEGRVITGRSRGGARTGPDTTPAPSS